MRFIKERFAVIWLSVTGSLPLWTHKGISQFIGFFLWVLHTRTRHVTETNIRHCFGHLEAKQQRCLAKKSLTCTVMTSLEMASIWRDPLYWLNHKVVGIEGQTLFDAALAKKKGVIVIMPHLGNWELLGLYVGGISPTLSLYSPPKITALESFIKRAREKTGATLVPTNNHGVGRLLKNLRKGGVTCILPDQVPNKSNGYVCAPFFGKDANTMTLVNGLAKKTDCVILCGCAMREGNGFKILFHEVCDRLSDKDSYISACGLNAAIEEAIKYCPEQYQWSYKRFKYQGKVY